MSRRFELTEQYMWRPSSVDFESDMIKIEDYLRSRGDNGAAVKGGLEQTEEGDGCLQGNASERGEVDHIEAQGGAAQGEGRGADDPVTNVLPFTGITKADLPVNYILDRAREHELTEVVIVGYDKDGQEFFASSRADAGQVVYHLNRGIWRINQFIDREMGDGD